MIKKFDEFDVNDYLGMKHLNEDVNMEDESNDVNDVKEEDIISGQAVYTDPYLTKISNIVLRKLNDANLGRFGINYNIVYVDGVPGVWIYGLDDNSLNVVCFRDTNEKKVAIFDTFEVNAKNTARTTYSSRTLGFKNILDKMINDLQGDEINEGYGTYNWEESDLDKYANLSQSNLKYLKGFLYTTNGTTINPTVAGPNLFNEYINGSQDAAILDNFKDKRNKVSPRSATIVLAITKAFISYIQNNRHCDDKKAPEEINALLSSGKYNNIITNFKNIGIEKNSIITSSGDNYNVGDELGNNENELSNEEIMKVKIAEDTVKYEKTLRKLSIMTDAMCHYVKQNGKIDADDESALIKRGLFLTGKGGIGKSYTIEQTLKRNNMIPNRDYVNVSSGSTTAESIYNYLYQYNNKLIIFDDTPDLFSTGRKMSMWKSALQTEGTESLLTYPLSVKEDTKNLYKTGVLTRQERYFKEMGRKSTSEKNEYKNRRLKELQKELGAEYDRTNALLVINDEWKEIEAETVPLMPNQFSFTGLVIIVGNDSRDVLRKEIGEGHWSAIIDRFQDYDLSPMSESIWEVIKNKILDEYNDTSIPDQLCLIPRDITEEFIEEIDNLIVKPQYKIITWRLIRAYGKKLRGKYGREDWKEDLKNDMNTNK